MNPSSCSEDEFCCCTELKTHKQNTCSTSLELKPYRNTLNSLLTKLTTSPVEECGGHWVRAEVKVPTLCFNGNTLNYLTEDTNTETDILWAEAVNKTQPWSDWRKKNLLGCFQFLHLSLKFPGFILQTVSFLLCGADDTHSNHHLSIWMTVIFSMLWACFRVLHELFSSFNSHEVILLFSLYELFFFDFKLKFYFFRKILLHPVLSAAYWLFSKWPWTETAADPNVFLGERVSSPCSDS